MNVLISGASFAGLSSAFWMQELGHAVTVVEVAPGLRTGGTFAAALALHVGDEVRHVDELVGESVDIDFVLHDADQVLAAVRSTGLVELEWYRRGPVGDEADTERLYVLARRGD